MRSNYEWKDLAHRHTPDPYDRGRWIAALLVVAGLIALLVGYLSGRAWIMWAGIACLLAAVTYAVAIPELRWRRYVRQERERRKP